MGSMWLQIEILNFKRCNCLKYTISICTTLYLDLYQFHSAAHNVYWSCEVCEVLAALLCSSCAKQQGIFLFQLQCQAVQAYNKYKISPRLQCMKYSPHFYIHLNGWQIIYQPFLRGLTLMHLHCDWLFFEQWFKMRFFLHCKFRKKILI